MGKNDGGEVSDKVILEFNWPYKEVLTPAGTPVELNGRNVGEVIAASWDDSGGYRVKMRVNKEVQQYLNLHPDDLNYKMTFVLPERKKKK